MRYFRTNRDSFLYWKYDEEKGQMWFTGDVSDPESWLLDDEEISPTPETLNASAFATYEPDHPMYAYETDENWNRLVPVD